MTAKRNPEGKMEAQKRDRERKRRDQLTASQLNQVRLTEKKYKKLKRNNMSEMDKQKAREVRNLKNRSKEVKKISNAEDLKEMKKRDEALRKRQYRSQLSEKEKSIAKLKAKIGMASGRKNGFLTSYKQRKSRKEEIRRKQIRDLENQKREEANRYKHFRWVWKGRNVNKKACLDEVCDKNIVRMRQYRTKIKEKINIKDVKTIYCGYDSSDNSSSDEEDIKENDWWSD